MKESLTVFKSPNWGGKAEIHKILHDQPVLRGTKPDLAIHHNFLPPIGDRPPSRKRRIKRKSALRNSWAERTQPTQPLHISIKEHPTLLCAEKKILTPKNKVLTRKNIYNHHASHIPPRPNPARSSHKGTSSPRSHHFPSPRAALSPLIPCHIPPASSAPLFLLRSSVPSVQRVLFTCFKLLIQPNTDDGLPFLCLPLTIPYREPPACLGSNPGSEPGRDPERVRFRVWWAVLDLCC